jgi:hypothetical protein
MNEKTPVVWKTTLEGVVPTKYGISLLAETIAEQVKAGEQEPLAVAVRLNAIESLAKQARELIAEDCLAELGRHPKGKAELMGAAVQVVDLPKYDYSAEPGWAELEAQITELKAKQKEIEEAAKKYHRGDLPVKSCSTSIKINLAK